MVSAIKNKNSKPTTTTYANIVYCLSGFFNEKVNKKFKNYVLKKPNNVLFMITFEA